MSDEKINSPEFDDMENDVSASDSSNGTFSEFISYARRRRQRGPRQAITDEPGRMPLTSFKKIALWTAAACSLFGVLLLWIVLCREESQINRPSWLKRHEERASALVNLPKPQVFGQVPECWGTTSLGTHQSELAKVNSAAYRGIDRWADILYVPDLAHPDMFFGLSFYRERVYKISVRFGDESTTLAAPYVAAGTAAYGAPKGYQYFVGSSPRAVSVFQTASRALKLDAFRRGDQLFLAEVTLVDLDAGAKRELEMARGH